MTESKLCLSCNDCKQESTFVISDMLKGRTLTFQCKHCPKRLKYFFPKEVSADLGNPTNTAFIDNQLVVGAFLELLDRRESTILKYPIEADENVVGRYSALSNGANIAINTSDKAMSRTHCIIKRQKSSRGSMVYTIKDNSSVNGVEINGRPLHTTDEIYLCHDDRIILGNTVLLFKEVYA